MVVPNLSIEDINYLKSIVRSELHMDERRVVQSEDDGEFKEMQEYCATDKRILEWLEDVRVAREKEEDID